MELNENSVTIRYLRRPQMFWKLDNTLQSNPWVQEEITREIRKYFKRKGKGKYMISNFVDETK